MFFYGFQVVALDLGRIAFLATYKDNLILVRPRNGEGNGTPLQYFCLENPMDRGAWHTTVHRIAMSRTELKQLSTHTCIT